MDAGVLVYNHLQALVGDDVEAIHAILLPPDAQFPCVVYAQIFGGEGVQVSGGVDSYNLRYQIDLYHYSFASLMALRRQIIDGFQRWSGGGVHDTRIDLDIPYIVDELDTSRPQLYRHIIDIGLSVERSIA